MVKYRVFEISKEYEIENKILIKAAQDLGFVNVKNHFGTLDEAQFNAIKEKLKLKAKTTKEAAIPEKKKEEDLDLKAEAKVIKQDNDGTEITEQRIRSTVIRRRRGITPEELQNELPEINKEAQPSDSGKTVSVHTDNRSDDKFSNDNRTMVRKSADSSSAASTSAQNDQIHATNLKSKVEDISKADTTGTEGKEKHLSHTDTIAARTGHEGEPKDLGKGALTKVGEPELTSEQKKEQENAREKLKAKEKTIHDLKNEDKKFVKFEPDFKDKKKLPDLKKLLEKEELSKVAKVKKGIPITTEDIVELEVPFAKENFEYSSHRKKKLKKGKKTIITVPKEIKRQIKIHNTISVAELSKKMGIKSGEIISKLMALGVMATMNQQIDLETATLIATDFSYTVENIAFEESEILGLNPDSPEDLIHRPPVVTVMGHVDHGKTSILDAIRKSNVAAGEAGGITQHIGAYTVEINSKQIAFIDTPGHEAFTSMRSRGAQATDIVVLVVAADDGVMPQTKEAISHAQAAKVPIIVAINKIDLHGVNPEKIKQELTEYNLVSEDWGGETIFVHVSAKTGQGIKELLEMILLQAEILELKANPKKLANGIVIESRVDKGRGAIATILIKNGTLKIGDYIVIDEIYGKVRMLFNHMHQPIKEAGPSVPVEVLGLSTVPVAGQSMHSVKDEKSAKQIAEHRYLKNREGDQSKNARPTLEGLFKQMEEKNLKDLNIIVKADTNGSCEALKASFLKLSNDKVKVNILHCAAGGITESDVILANASSAIIIGFNVRPESGAQLLSETNGIEIKSFSIIYEAIDSVKAAMDGMLSPVKKEQYLGRAEVRDLFNIPKIGTVAGTSIINGKVTRNSLIRLIRDNVIIYNGKLKSLRRFKEDVKEVATGYECGIGIENYNDLKIGDIIEAYKIEEVQDTMN